MHFIILSKPERDREAVGVLRWVSQGSGEKLFSSSHWLCISFITSLHVVSSRDEGEKGALCLQSVALCVGEALRG